ncbi:Pex12 amino terminal region-domain-containing protein [Chytridium lagenaria]|nr:Pex12 amino terminal region-domain-containing protein [Chytridium lagenaria]
MENARYQSRNPSRPSAFELLAEGKMRGMIKPAFRYVLAVYAQRYPRYLLPILKHHHELFALMVMMLDYQFIKESGGSMSENFYGLKRVAVGKVRRGKAKPVNPWLSLLFLIAIPYLKDKLDEFYEDNQSSLSSPMFEDSAEESSTVKVYYHFMEFEDCIFKNIPCNDGAEIQKKRSEATITTGSLSISTILQKTGTLSFNALRLAFPLSIFFYKFLEWWYTSDQKTVTSFVVPPPPPILKEESDSDTSGYVYCFTCITPYVREMEMSDELRKIFSS